ncbi:MAG TPA: ATP-binding cassette domain-containing protein [Lacipirellulaceae bacterium]|nr:ATP-binding cassette domain-containing protein [Lacipirellulaceae bacterium]
MPASAAIAVQQLTHRYGSRTAVDDLTLRIEPAEIFAFLGPNGSGKTTLFRVLSTLIPPQSGAVEILGHDLARQAAAVRRQLGVVFQSPSLDKKLTVAENLLHQGRLYGLGGAELRSRSAELLATVGLAERATERVETLSGGMRRRAELAKCLLHRPRLLLLDEPSTGLDPGARIDLWRYLAQLRTADGVTVVLTTHLLDEAERADRIAILHQGGLAALGPPAELRAAVGGDAVTIQSQSAQQLAAAITGQFGLAARVLDGAVRLEVPRGHEWIPRLVAAFPESIQTITLGKPTLEDVFIARTGHRFFGQAPEEHGPVKQKRGRR